MRLTPLLSALLLSGACASDAGRPAGAGHGPGGKADDLASCTPTTQRTELVSAFGGRQFQLPVAMQQEPTTGRWYVAEKRGVIWTFVEQANGSVTTPTVFADIRNRVNDDPNEAGLLGFALAPDFASSGRLYLSYTAPSSSSPANLRSRLTRVLSTDGGLTMATGEEILLQLDQPFENHNGGHVVFGPDGLLYLGLGDGGSAGDPGNRAQNKDLWFGKLLRIDVDQATGYSIPADNPFAGGGGAKEIYALGLRNPWRFSFDPPSGRLWLGDVGQDQSEEVDLIVKGGNYGWRIREASHCFNPPVSCPTAGLIDPVAEYGHAEGISITGGHVYRGSAIPALVGQYIFTDFGSGTFWALRETSAGTFSRRQIDSASVNIASFAVDRDGEHYAIDIASGDIYKLAGESCDAPAAPDAGIDEGPDAGVVEAPDAGPGGPDVSFADVFSQVIGPRCSGCHGAMGAGGLSMPTASTARTNLVNKLSGTMACGGRTRVVPGDADGSLLLSKVNGQDLCGALMPIGGSLSNGEISLIRDWIAGGAQP